jgi:hypothetical protein
MNGQPISQKPTTVQVIAVIAGSVIAGIGMFALMWCAIWRLYIDSPLLISISNITSGVAGALTTILVGRSISQLNQPDQPIQTEIKQPPDKPVPVAVETQKPEGT